MRTESMISRGKSRIALTLMELVVVLSVLVALAAIVVPMFPNLLRRAHKASDATQSQEVSKLIQLYQGMYNAYPNDWDVLANQGAATFPDYLPGGATTPFGGYVINDVLTPGEVGALANVGITTVQTMASSTAALNPDGDGVKQPSLNPYATLGGIDSDRTLISATTKVAVLNLAQIATLNPQFLETVISASVNDPTFPSTPRFVVFGVGPRNSMVGKVMQDAPTSVPQNPDLTPAKQYCHFGAIFMVSGAEVSRTGRARFIAAVAMEDDELELTTKDATGYYQVAQ